MRGFIRTVVGLIIVAGCAGCVGGMDNATDAQLLPLIGIAIVGLLVMYSGVRASNGRGR